jgi:hypothetical protein
MSVVASLCAMLCVPFPAESDKGNVVQCLKEGVAPTDVVVALQCADEEYDELCVKAGAKSKKGKRAKGKSKTQLRLDKLTPLLKGGGYLQTATTATTD